ncbi:hypothetical protein HAX54_052563 [Datura stramonium]|uniref:Uncharacterized protein n=1 Tax=Datura stramonium TaxID=4076 RepID=A0ABS8WTD5_DATST|nr:hypothetical protein [Datura stramonium]
MLGIDVNLGKVLAFQIKWKARQPALSIPFPVLISKMCAREGMHYFDFDRPCYTIRYILESSLGHDTESSQLEKDLGDPIPTMSGDAFKEVLPPRSSPLSPPSRSSGIQKVG